jgi:hypothetical protein
MRLDTLTLAVPSAVGNGVAQSVRDLREKYVQVDGVFAGSLDIEVSLNGGNTFAKSAVALTAPGIRSIPEPATHVRVVMTALTSGAATAVITGFNARTEG